MSKCLFFILFFATTSLFSNKPKEEICRLRNVLECRFDLYSDSKNPSLKKLRQLETAKVNLEEGLKNCDYDQKSVETLKLTCEIAHCFIDHQRIIEFKQSIPIQPIIDQHGALLNKSGLSLEDHACLKMDLYTLTQAQINPKIKILKRDPEHYLNDRNLLSLYIALKNVEPSKDDLEGTSKEYRRKINRERNRRNKQIKKLEKATYNPILAEIYPNLFG